MEQLKGLIEEFLRNMGVKDPGVTISQGGAQTKAHISLDDAGYMIGKEGENIHDIEKILKLLARRKGVEGSFSIDINNYRGEREAKLKDYIRKVARQVVMNKKEVRLPPMRPFERRVIHLELATHPDIVTESIGDGEERYVVVKPYP